jgi:replicative DNA helicase
MSRAPQREDFMERQQGNARGDVFSTISGTTFCAPTGVTVLDKMIGGFHEQELIIIGSQPGMGKTALALFMAHHMTMQQRIPVLFFSLEMSCAKMGQRLLAIETQLSLQDIRTDVLSSDHTALSEAPLSLIDTPGLTMPDIVAEIRTMVKQQRAKVIFIDYLSLILPDHVNRSQQMLDMVCALKTLARDLHISIVVLSLLGQITENRGPTFADLRYSKTLAQDADIVLFLHREGGHENEPVIPTTITVAKQRNGPTGAVQVEFDKQRALFMNRG